MNRPRIGITRGTADDRPHDQIPGTYQRYFERVREAGGEPVDLHEFVGTPAADLIRDLDGVVISGGPDIDPSRFGQPPHPTVQLATAERDELELSLIQAALARDLPVLAICRGHQALNVAMGGALLQHIEGDHHRADSHPPYDSKWHDVRIATGSRLHTFTGRESMPTNSRHHQAVTAETLASGLIPTAWSPDGLIEGVESHHHRWVVGVQWHPEREEVMDAFRPLFAAFVQEAARHPVRAAE